MPEDRPIDYPAPTRFVLGTIGMPGSREFYLQAAGPASPGGTHLVTTVKLEKQQAAALAERVDEVVESVAAGSAPPPSDTEPLELGFVGSAFQVGTMSIRWDTETERIVLEFFDINDDDDESPDVPTVDPRMRVALTPSQARGFVDRSAKIIAAGRPPCPFCSEPLDPEGHICPRANGYRR